MPDFVGVLLFIFFFIVLPILSGSSKKKKQTGQSPQRPAQVPSQPLNTPPASKVEEDFEKRLTEARKRVQEAIEKQESASQVPSSTTYQAPPPVSKPVFAPTPVAPYSPQAAPKKASLETTVPLGGNLEGNISKSKELKKPKDSSVKQRLEKPAQKESYIKSKMSLPIGLKSRDIMAGLVWKQILDKPKAKKRYLDRF